jgi:hypothetical protein
MKFLITYGVLSENEEVIDAASISDAEGIAYQYAIEDYESYEGLHGIRSIEDIIEEEQVDEEEATEIYREEVESTIMYSAERV